MVDIFNEIKSQNVIHYLGHYSPISTSFRNDH